MGQLKEEGEQGDWLLGVLHGPEGSRSRRTGHFRQNGVSVRRALFYSEGTVTGSPKEQSKEHHHVPQFMLRGFTGPEGRLTVVRVRPTPEVQRGKHPRRVGAVPRLNSWEHPDGTYDDELERVPLNRLDSFGAEGLRDVVEFARAVEPEGQLRLLDRHWEDRVPLTMHTAGLMVRSPKLRGALDDQALPTMIEHMRSGLLRQVAEASAAEEDVRPVLFALDRPGMVKLEPGRNRHQAALVDLITTATAAIGATHVVSVRRVAQPLLTGSEPVVLLRDADIVGGVSCAQLLAAADPPVAFWEERPDMLARVNENPDLDRRLGLGRRSSHGGHDVQSRER
jgi:Protein of unknown function (DUF4238)